MNCLKYSNCRIIIGGKVYEGRSLLQQGWGEEGTVLLCCPFF
ncbi:hypothetical protein [Bartonella tribocorum]|nr:hypothetical protein [Bartonella tribocorum]